MTVHVQEIRIFRIEGLAIPDNITEGSEINITAKLYVSQVEQEWVDVTTTAGQPKQLPGKVTICTVVREWNAA